MVSDKNWYRTNRDFTGALNPTGVAVIESINERVAAGEDVLLERFYRDDTNIFDDDWIAYFEDKVHGNKLADALVFGRRPHYQYPTAHIDTGSKYNKAICAFNWIYGDVDDSEMVWYETPDQSMFDQLAYTEVSTPYYEFDPADLVETWAEPIGNSNCMSLVQVDIPHNIRMHSTQRQAISVRVKHDFNA